MNPKLKALENLKSHLAGRRKAALGAKVPKPGGPVVAQASPTPPSDGDEDDLMEALSKPSK